MIVIFRADKQATLPSGMPVVYAIYPTEPYDLTGTSYEADTLHGGTGFAIDLWATTRPATEAEYRYAGLYQQVQQRHTWPLEVYRRRSAAMRRWFDAELRDARSTVRRESDCQLPDDRDIDWGYVMGYHLA